MEQRRPRLGDILDDYCPRERRITNHVIVAMIEDAVKQTRCTTCSADHDYKQGRTPSQRRAKPGAPAPADLADAAAEPRPALASPAKAPTEAPAPALDAPDGPVAPAAPEPVPADEYLPPVALVAVPERAVAAETDRAPDDVPVDDLAREDDDGPVHRRLIRATLPRPEGQVPERKAPEFTVRQPSSGRGRGDFDGNRVGGGGGHRPPGQRSNGGQGGPGGPSRFGGQRHGAGPHGQGQRSGPPGGQRGGRPAGGADGNSRGQGPGPGRRRGR